MRRDIRKLIVIRKLSQTWTCGPFARILDVHLARGMDKSEKLARKNGNLKGMLILL